MAIMEITRDYASENEKRRYDGLDGLRTLACFGIVLMHMASRDNNNYSLPNSVAETIGSFTDFVFLFMAVSAFGLCCGYYEKVLNGTIDFKRFYQNRYLRVLPFYALVVLIDVVMEFSRNTVIEAIADISLTFGLFQNNITVIGVGWFLGLIFAFYMIFPFYCVLIHSKTSAWITFFASLILNCITGSYFGMGRQNIVYSLCFFVLGGIIYLYREKIEMAKLYVTIPIICIAVFVYYRGRNTISLLLLTTSLMVFAVSNQGERLLHCKLTSFISKISLEIYLCHMVIFRGIERLRLNMMFGAGTLQYVTTVMIVILGSIIFALIFKKIEKLINLYVA